LVTTSPCTVVLL